MFNGSFPTFDFDSAGFGLALARGLFIVAIVSSYGAILYRVRLAGPTLKAMPGKAGIALAQRYDRLARGSLIAVLITGLGWLAGEACTIFSTHGLTPLFHAVPETLFSTSFGHLLLLQIILAMVALGGVIGAKRNKTWRDLALAASGLVVVLQAGHEHAASMYSGISILMLSEIAHLLAAAAWLGSLVPLLLTVRYSPHSSAHAAAVRFSRFGMTCVIVLAVTALFQGWQLIGSVPGLIGTAYGWMAIAKLVLFAVLLCFAASNRIRLTPMLGSSGVEAAKAKLVRSIGFETVAGFAILIAAATLVSLPPAIHEQPVWPFTSTFSLVTVSEDIGFFSDVILSLFALVVALAIIAASLYFKRFLLPALAVALAIAWFAVPSLDLLFVEAYPTSFYHSPTEFAATSIAAGAALYPDNCASCHGVEGRGDGPLAKNLAVPPADLTAPHLWAHADGELFWWLTDGIKTPEGEQVMPPFRDLLSDDERWNLIDFIRARNAGLTYASTGAWSPNVRAPQFQATCKGATVTSGDMRGRVIRLVFADVMPETPETADTADRLVTVLAGAAPAPSDETHCLAPDPSLIQAYAIVSGIPADKLTGTEFLIDTNGWLRDVQKPGETINWNDPGALAAQVVKLCSHPLAAGGHAHHEH